MDASGVYTRNPLYKEEKKGLSENTPQYVRNASETLVRAFFDGICEPRNPGGYACGGWYVEASPEVASGAGPLAGHRFYAKGEGATNNVAEYNAALDALRAIYRTGYRGPVELVGNSQIVVRQFSGEYACNKPALQELLKQLRYAATFFERVTLRWVPRDENAIADAESRKAYVKARRGS